MENNTNLKLNQFSNLLETFVSTLVKGEEYSHLDVEISIKEANGQGEKLKIDSNGSLILKNSIKATNEIKKNALSFYEACGLDCEISVTLSLQKKAKNNSKISKSRFVAEKPKYKLQDVILPEDTRQNIEDALAMIEHFDLVYDVWGFRSKEPSAKTNICFYGVPGTGKTMCAHGIAEHLKKNILIASYADIQSEYVGVGPKNLRDVFKEAEENNAVLFFDEADSFLRKRTSDTNSSAAMHYNSMTNEMMKHLEDFNGIVIFATNLTENTDDAFKTRLATSVEFKVPDEACRSLIIKGMIPNAVPLEKEFTEDDFLSFAQECDGMVGRDIRNAVKRILCKGAHTGIQAFTAEDFVKGFMEYRENKDKFDESVSGKKNKGVNPLDVYNANGAILSLLTYAVWYDDKESDEEALILKKYARILSRNKPIINKLSDLPDIDEICEEIKDVNLKHKAIEYVCEAMSTNPVRDKNEEIIKLTIKALNLIDCEEKYLQYYECLSKANDFKNSITIK